MAPVLDDVAGKITGKMSIGTIDCTVEKRLCNDNNVRGYPTLKFSLDGEIHDYPGGRKESDFIAFAEKLSRRAVQLHASVADAMTSLTETDEGVAFIAYHPALSGDSVDDKLQSSLLTQIYAQVARKERAYGTFYLLPESALDAGELAEGAFVCRIEQNVAPLCYPTAAKPELETLSAFVKTNNVATVSHLGPHNFHKVGHSGRPLVIGVVDTDNKEQVDEVKRILAQYATGGPETVRDQYHYGFFDGKVFQKFLMQFDVVPEDMPQVFLLDVPGKKYWQNATYALNVEDFLAAVEAKEIRPKVPGPGGFKGVANRIYYAMVEYRPYSIIIAVLIICLFGVVVLSILWPADGESWPSRAPPPPAGTDAVQETPGETESKKDK